MIALMLALVRRVEAADNAEAVAMFRNYLAERPDLVDIARRELRGKTLLCWCALDVPCHADVWLEIANA